MKHLFARQMSIGSALLLIVLAALFAYFVNI